MIFAILKYIPKVILSYAALLFTALFGPIIALFYFKEEESKVTGYPSQFPGKLREHISFPFRWATTFDDCADAHWYSGRMKRLTYFGFWQPFKNLTDEQFEASSWYRYLARVFWLYRNPNYGLSLALGFDQTGLEITTIRDESHLWDNGYPNTTYRTFTNIYGEKGFLWEKQIHLGNQWFLEFVLGYKVPWDNEEKAMLGSRVTVKKYPKVSL